MTITRMAKLALWGLLSKTTVYVALIALLAYSWLEGDSIPPTSFFHRNLFVPFVVSLLIFGIWRSLIRPRIKKPVDSGAQTRMKHLRAVLVGSLGCLVFGALVVIFDFLFSGSLTRYSRSALQGIGLMWALFILIGIWQIFRPGATRAANTGTDEVPH
jgi:hypothetical protein